MRTKYYIFWLILSFMEAVHGEQLSETNEATVLYFEPRDSLLEPAKKVSTWTGHGLYYHVSKEKFFKIEEIRTTPKPPKNIFPSITQSLIKIEKNGNKNFENVEFSGAIICHESSDLYLFFGSFFWKQDGALWEPYKSTKLALAIAELRREK